MILSKGTIITQEKEITELNQHHNVFFLSFFSVLSLPFLLQSECSEFRSPQVLLAVSQSLTSVSVMMSPGLGLKEPPERFAVIDWCSLWEGQRAERRGRRKGGGGGEFNISEGQTDSCHKDPR